ncbi:hypothetical protein B0O99DRAFT_524007 [Bisporella sp. PMI_857]|nr:hypothetical protein B0O99DRAFT_524007 [Bisporella sp. PMI_857]
MTSPPTSPPEVSSTRFSQARVSLASSSQFNISRNAHTLSMQATDNDCDWAKQLMMQHRMNNNKGRIPSSSDFTYKEATAVLTKIAEGVIPNATPGLVQALIDSDADVCLARRKSNSLFKAMRSKDQDDVRSNLLEKAARHCSVDILMLLVMKADDTALNQALPAAITGNEVEKARVLLARGADASLLCNEFLNAVDTGSDDMVDALMGNIKGSCQFCRDKGLVRAATSGQANKVSRLLQKGANRAFDGAAALRASINAGWEDIAADIVSHKGVGLDLDLLDLAVGESYAKAQYQALEACLRAGARGPTTNTVLIHTVEHGQYELADSLVRYGASVECQSGAPVVSAVRRGEPKLLRAVLRGKPSQSAMAAAISQIGKLGDIRIAHQMIELLLSAGLRGDAVSETLIQVLDAKLLKGDENSRYGLALLLLEKGGAAVDMHSGRSFALAAGEGWANILHLLIQCRPSVESLMAAFEPAMRIANPDLRKQIVGMVVDAGSSRRKFTECLNTAAVTAAAKSLRLDILEYLAKSKLSIGAILAGFAAAVLTGVQWTTPSGLEVVQFFLNHGAEGPSVDDAFCKAAIRCERDALELLSQSISPSTVGKALRDVVEYSRDWHLPDDRNIWLLELLLEWGAQGEPVNLALLKAVSCFVVDMASETLIDALIFKADVNFHAGEALKIAVRGGNVTLLRKLVEGGADKESMTHAFHEAIVSPLGEDIVLGLINVLAESQDLERKVNFEAVLPNRHPPIVDCLTTHPESVNLVRRLAELGCDVNAQFETYLYDFAEPANALAWALGPSRLVSSVAIEELIALKANVNFVAPLSKATPLILASKYHRGDIVKKLIKANANACIRDYVERTPLFFASHVGNLDAVKALLKVKCRPNDGSLHEAARNLHSDIVAALIKGGQHDANFPSSRSEHEGRTPLQEMAYRCDGSKGADDMEATIAALERGKANILEKWCDKNSLFLALDNAKPYTVTKALLHMVMWRVINDDDNVLAEVNPETGVKYFMSPTIYLQRWSRSSDNKSCIQACSKLEQLLRTMHCVDKFYAQLGAVQPANAVGMPENIAKEDKKRRDEAEKRLAREVEHQEKLRREREEAQQKDRIEALKHEAWQRREFEKTATKVDSSQVVHQNQLTQHAQMSTQQREALTAQNLCVEQSKVRKAMIDSAALRQQQGLKLDHQQQTGQQKFAQQAMQEMLKRESAQAKLIAEKRSQNLKAAADRQKLQTQKAVDEQKARQQRNDLLHKRKMRAEK